MTARTVENIKAEMFRHFGSDRRRVNHALKVLDYARRINRIEGADTMIVETAALLHDIGIHAAEEKHHSTAGRFQEMEGPPIARKILERNGLAPEAIEHICKIIANHHSAKNIDTPEFRVIWDADWLVNIPDEYETADKEKLSILIKRIFKTNRGKQLARELYLESCNNNQEECIGKPR